MSEEKVNYLKRREDLCKRIEEDSVIIVASSSVKKRNSDSNYPFRQDSNFFYLSGYDEPESLIVLRPEEKEKYILFCRDREPALEQWEGFRSGQEGAIEKFKADGAYSITKLDELMPSLIEGKKNIYYSMSSPNGLNNKIKKWVNEIRRNIRGGSECPLNLISLDSIIDEMRLIKSTEELDLMRRACEITSVAHKNAMQKVSPGMFEYQLEAEYLYSFMQGGSRSPAYNSIVGGGNNACILHYSENSSILQDGSLVLVDAGCEYEHYASDVTRTFPVNGKFSVEQKEIYKIVLEAHTEALKEVKPGNPYINVHNRSIEVITEGLISLGLLEGKVVDLINKGAFSKYYMHRVGHWLGMDVHDVGNYKVDGEWRRLEEGMVLTIEPGIYILDNMEQVDKKWLGIGVRIEDDGLVTSEGNEILTSMAPREPEDIESLMSS